ncbi:MAG TPA: NnrU family protein [Thiobacillaceae bacterium]
MRILLLGLVIFFGGHSVSIVSDAWRDRMAAKMGEWEWKALYSLVALVGVVLIAWGYGLARHDPVPVYAPPEWLRSVAMLLLIPVFPLLLATYLPGRIRAAAKHPMLAATQLWAFAHLLANGTLADLLLFGTFLAWAVADRLSMAHRTQRPVPALPASRANDLVAVAAGLALWAAFILWLHGWLIGVPLRPD